MSTITFKGGRPIPQKPKKKKSLFARIFWPIFIVIFVLPIVSAGVLVALVYDDTHIKVNCREEYPNEELFSDIITHSLDYTAEQHQMRLRLTEDALNQLFYNAMHKDGEPSIELIRNFYVKVTKKNYIFGLEVDLYGWYKTRLQLTTKLTITDEDIIFKVTDIQLGKLKGLDKLATFIIERVDIPDINKVFQENGFNMTLDLKKLTLTYPKESLFEDLTKSFGDSDNAYTSLFTEIMFNDNYLTILRNNEKAVEFNINLENMRPTSETYNITGYQMPEGYLNTILPNSMNKVKTYLDSDAISVDNAQSIANYYVRGYDYLDESDKSVVNSYLTSHAIDEATDTYNYEISPSENLLSIATAQLVHYGMAANYYEVDYSTDQIDRALSQASVIGTTILFKAKDLESGYITNYIAVDRISNIVDYQNGGFYIAISLNFNGYDVALTMKTVTDSSHNVFGQVKFDVEELYIGNEPLSEATKTMFLDVISSAMQDGAFGSAMSYHSEGGNQYLLIDLTDALTSMGISEAAGYATSFEILEQTATTPGTLKFEVSK